MIPEEFSFLLTILNIMAIVLILLNGKYFNSIFKQYQLLQIFKNIFELYVQSKLVLAKLIKAGIHCISGAGCVGSIHAISYAQHMPSFRHWRFKIKLSPIFQILPLNYISALNVYVISEDSQVQLDNESLVLDVDEHESRKCPK